MALEQKVPSWNVARRVPWLCLQQSAVLSLNKNSVHLSLNRRCKAERAFWKLLDPRSLDLFFGGNTAVTCHFVTKACNQIFGHDWTRRIEQHSTTELLWSQYVLLLECCYTTSFYFKKRLAVVRKSWPFCRKRHVSCLAFLIRTIEKYQINAFINLEVINLSATGQFWCEFQTPKVKKYARQSASPQHFFMLTFHWPSKPCNDCTGCWFTAVKILATVDACTAKQSTSKNNYSHVIFTDAYLLKRWVRWTLAISICSGSCPALFSRFSDLWRLWSIVDGGGWQASRVVCQGLLGKVQLAAK